MPIMQHKFKIGPLNGGRFLTSSSYSEEIVCSDLTVQKGVLTCSQSSQSYQTFFFAKWTFFSVFLPVSLAIL
jgi:hypothetical protein